MSLEDFEDAANGMMDEIAQEFPTWYFNISRPDYTSQTTDAEMMQSAVSLFIEPISASASQDKIPGAEYFLIACDHSILKAGDIVVPASPHPSLVPMTVVNADPNVDALAVKTGHIGSLYNSKNKLLFSNVQFEFLKMSKEGPPPELDDVASLPIRAANAIIYARCGIQIGHMLYNEDENMYFEILNIMHSTHFQILTLHEDRR